MSLSLEQDIERLSRLDLSQGSGFEPVKMVAWKKRILETPSFVPLLEEIRAEAQRYRGVPVPELSWSLFRRYHEDGDRHAYQEVYFNRRKRLTAFGLLGWLEPDHANHRDALLDIVWSICDEYTWCLPAHLPAEEEAPEGFDPSTKVDLFAAETAFALAELIRLTGEWWPTEVRRRVESEVRRRVLSPYLNGKTFGWETVENNWSAVCAGSIGAAAIHLIDDPKELSEVLKRVLPSLSCFLAGYGPDGVCKEGYGYWVYGFGYFIYFADLLRGKTAGAIDLMAEDKIKQIAMFQEISFLDGDQVVNFSDAVPRSHVFLGLSHYLHGRYPEMSVPMSKLRAPFEDDHCGRWAPALRNLIWYDPDLPGEAWKEGSYDLPDAQWLVSRQVTDDGIGFGFAAKGGHNDEPHNHNDIGHFMLMADGETFFADLGSGPYNKAYFGPERYQIMCNGSQGHSVPIVDGCLQIAGRKRVAKMLRAEVGDRSDQLEMELAAAYDYPPLRSLFRKLTWDKPTDEAMPTLRLEDDYIFAETPSNLIERFVCALKPEAGPKSGSLVMAGKRLRLVLSFDPAAWQPAVTPLPFVNHRNVEVQYFLLDFQQKPVVPAANGRSNPSAFACPFQIQMQFEWMANR